MTTGPLPKRLSDLGTDHPLTPIQPGTKIQGQPQIPRLARETARKDFVCCLLRKKLKIRLPTAVCPEAFNSLSLKRRRRDRPDFPWLLVAYTRKSRTWPPLQPRFLKLPADELGGDGNKSTPTISQRKPLSSHLPNLDQKCDKTIKTLHQPCKLQNASQGSLSSTGG